MLETHTGKEGMMGLCVCGGIGTVAISYRRVLGALQLFINVSVQNCCLSVVLLIVIIVA